MGNKEAFLPFVEYLEEDIDMAEWNQSNSFYDGVSPTLVTLNRMKSKCNVYIFYNNLQFLEFTKI